MNKEKKHYLGCRSSLTHVGDHISGWEEEERGGEGEKEQKLCVREIICFAFKTKSSGEGEIS